MVKNRHLQLFKRFSIPNTQQQNKNPKQQKTLLLSRYNMLHEKPQPRDHKNKS